MKIYEISEDHVFSGANVTSFDVAGQKIPAILIGEEGRGRKLGVLPVHLLPDSYREWNEKGKVEIGFSEVGVTKSGRPKLIQTDTDTDPDNIVAVMRSPIGFRGGNAHTGDRTPETFEAESGWEFLPFPGQIICSGVIAQGAAGAMGGGDQIVAVIPTGTTFRVSITGRRYSAPGAYYYHATREGITAATFEQRILADLF